jgi:diaminopimelate decarboxylase
MLRLTPGIEAHTHEKISTAHEDVKFGFSIASGSAWIAVEAVAQHPELELLGVHCHIGSKIFGTEAHEIATDRLVGFMAKYRDTYGTQLPELDLGGGFGIAYIDGEKTVEPADVLPAIHAAVTKACAQHNLDIPLVSLEPGRNIVGPTMFTLYEVGTVKDVVIEGGTVRKYVSVDGGMSDNARTALYDAEYTAVIAQRSSTAPLALTRVVGKHCETGDILINEIQLPSDIAPGDLLATPATGAYGRSMASNYNHVPRPPPRSSSGSCVPYVSRYLAIKPTRRSVAISCASVPNICEPIWQWTPRSSSSGCCATASTAVHAEPEAIENPNFTSSCAVEIFSWVCASIPGVRRSITD